MAKTTKLELEQLLAQRNEEIQHLRHRVSVLEGQLALRAAPRTTTPSGVVIERHGQRTIKRYPARNACAPAAQPVPRSAAECEFGDAEYQWRLHQAGL